MQLIQEGYLVSNIMETLATEVGFSTYSSFFKNFKEITKIAPQEYSQKVIVALAKFSSTDPT